PLFASSRCRFFASRPDGGTRSAAVDRGPRACDRRRPRPARRGCSPGEDGPGPQRPSRGPSAVPVPGWLRIPYVQANILAARRRVKGWVRGRFVKIGQDVTSRAEPRSNRTLTWVDSRRRQPLRRNGSGGRGDIGPLDGKLTVVTRARGPVDFL